MAAEDFKTWKAEILESERPNSVYICFGFNKDINNWGYTYPCSPEFAQEIAKRWNEYEGLQQLLKRKRKF